jgi:hypothetical protein
MARAPVSKTDYFSFKINMHSEKIEEFNLLPASRLAADSEYDPLTSVRFRVRGSCGPRLASALTS